MKRELYDHAIRYGCIHIKKDNHIFCGSSLYDKSDPTISVKSAIEEFHNTWICEQCKSALLAEMEVGLDRLAVLDKEREARKNVSNICSRCGECCHNVFGRTIDMTSGGGHFSDITYWKGYNRTDILDRIHYLDDEHAIMWKGVEVGEACPFLDRKESGIYSCSIWWLRPRACREFITGIDCNNGIQLPE